MNNSQLNNDNVKSENENKKLEKILTYKTTMKLLSGLTIMDNSNDLNIGGADTEVIKDPITRKPYIPGSSLKGKLRSLLELRDGTYTKYGQFDGKNPCACGGKRPGGKCLICTIFGAYKNPKAKTAPTRIIVRDSFLTEESNKVIDDLLADDGNYLEEKTENIVNRDTGTAEAPRTIERVPAGLEFNVEIILQIYGGDDEEAMKQKIRDALILLQHSYLGSSGSRGYGQVEIDCDKEWKEFDVQNEESYVNGEEY